MYFFILVIIITIFYIYYLSNLIISIATNVWLFNYNKPNMPNKLLNGYNSALFKHSGSVLLASIILPITYIIKIPIYLLIFLFSVLFSKCIGK